MAYDFASRLDRLGSRKQELDSRPVRYVGVRNDITLTVDLDASVSTLRRIEESETVLTTVITPRNYIITTRELILGGKQELPKAGDKIVDQDGTFEILPNGQNPPFNYTTQSRKRLRIEVKQVSPECLPSLS